jgi:hypothetical protein
MPYTLTMLFGWSIAVACLGAVVGYLVRGRPIVIDSASVGTRLLRATDADELSQLDRRVERLDTQLALALAERDRLRAELDEIRLDRSADGEA